ncbi:hypothetical protein BS78_10G221500 [Paspalum vaginatum]|nr:hypothetical protein BS78_10G221200 [Paspalum vaginatum]KAJ1260296.1 hypothetical protein BS78_10G221500 [Paspalum vaginatum]
MATRALGGRASPVPSVCRRLPFFFSRLHPWVGAVMAAAVGLLASLLFPTPINVHTSQIVASSKMPNCSVLLHSKPWTGGRRHGSGGAPHVARPTGDSSATIAHLIKFYWHQPLESTLLRFPFIQFPERSIMLLGLYT